jgi:hypothetical protein
MAKKQRYCYSYDRQNPETGDLIGQSAYCNSKKAVMRDHSKKKAQAKYMNVGKIYKEPDYG